MKILTKFPLATSIEPELLGNIEKRLDPFYYCHLKALPKIKSEIVLLKEICNINPKREVKRLTDDMMVPYIGLPNTDEHTGTVINVEMRPYKEVKGRNIVFEKDILFARIEPSIYNRKYIYVDKLPQKYAFTSTEFHILEAKKGINPKYIFWIIRIDFVYNQVFGKVKGTTGRRRLDKSELEEFKIPFPQTEIRYKLITIMEKAHKERIEKIKKSKKLINGINEILLEQLDLKLPSTKEKTIFLTMLEDESENRFDVFYYRPKYITLLDTIKKSKYEVKTLKQISKTIVNGQRPKGGVKYIKDGVPSIGGEHITSEGDFNFENIRYIPKEFHRQQKKKKSWIKPFDILIVKDGATTGKVAIVSKDFPFQECNINEHVFRIEVKDDYNPYYIFSFLFSELGQEQINRLISGAAQKGITRDAIESVKIVLPSLEFQNKIANEVNKRKEESKRLKKEAEEVVKKAKKEVEKLIIGK